MSSLQAQLEALQQQHQFTVMELTDLKEDNERIRKLNTTILENMMKEQPSEMLSEIKVMIDGGQYVEKMGQLEKEIQMLRAGVEAQVQRRVQEVVKGIRVPEQAPHDCQNCQKCIKYREECPNCSSYQQKIRNYEKILAQKSQRIDSLRLQIQQAHSQFQAVKSRVQQQSNQKISELQQINKMLSASLHQHQYNSQQNQHKLQQLNQQWQNQYNGLAEQYNSILEELEQYKNMQQVREDDAGRKRNMMMEIQNIMGELGNRKDTRVSKLSRVSSRDSDFSAFSIKDAINRPNKFTFY